MLLRFARLLPPLCGAVSVALIAGLQVHAATPTEAAFVMPQEERALVVEPARVDRTAGALELSLTLPIKVTNTGREPIVIQRVRTTCGCSVPKAPPQPWRLAPGETGHFDIIVDLRGKRGVLDKQAFLDTARGYKAIDFRITIAPPDPHEEMRLRNLIIAQADRQAVFKNDCAQCHAEPTKGKRGRELYVAACAICHADEHRASMVPDLRALTPPPTADLWRHVITAGKEGTLMPAFAQENEGPLTREQIDSLVEYLTTAFREEKPAAKPAEKPAGY